MELMDSFRPFPSPSLPHKLVLDHIIARLPVQSVFECLSVCKIWSSYILSDPDFASSHVIQYSQKNPCFLYEFGKGDGTKSFYVSSPQEDSRTDYVDTFEMIISGSEDRDLRRELVGSCNGLVCLYNNDSHRIEVYNPTRHHTLSIHAPHPIIPVDQFRYGFGYDSISGEYNVVCILFEMSKCKVLSFGSRNSDCADWVEIPFNESLILKLSNDDPSQSRRTNLFNEFIQRRGPTFYDRCFWWIHGKELFSLHIDHKNFRVIKLPPESLRGYSLMLLVHKGKLYCAKFNAVCRGTVRWSIDLFMLEVQDQEHTWRNKKISLPFISPGHSVQLVDFNNELLLHQVLGDGCIMTYNLHTRKLKDVRKLTSYGEKKLLSENLVNSTNWYNWASNTHVQNLLSLESIKIVR